MRPVRPVRFRRPAYTYSSRSSANGLWQGGDSKLLIVALMLISFGIMMIYSASGFVAIGNDKPDWFYFLKQLALVAVGFIAFIIGARVDAHVYRYWVKLGLICIGAVMLCQLFLPVGPVINGARRWISLGLFNLQTSEIARSLIIVYMAKVLSDDQQFAERIEMRFFLVLTAPFILIVLTFVQPDLSSSAIMALMVVLLLYFAGMKRRYVLLTGLLGLSGVVGLALNNPYQKKRLLGFLNPFSDLEGVNYQTVQSLVGFAKGGLFGVGLGGSDQKMLYLPEPFSDMIYSVIAEEWGLVGATFVLLAFMVLFLRIVRISVKQVDRYSFFLGAGLGCSLIIYAFTNMAVAVGMLPVTGLPLPYLSAGGTSLVVSMWSIGVLWRLSKKANNHV